MKKNSSMTVLLCGLIAMIVTILFYMLAFDNIFTLPMRWLSLLFLLIVEVIGIVKALKFNRSVLGVTTIVISLIHLSAVFVISIIFVNLLPFLIKQYVLLNLLLIAVIAIVDILILYFNNRAKESNQKYSNASAVIDECLITAEKILIEIETLEYKDDIHKVVEMLRYSNRNELCGTEGDILTRLEELHNLIRTDGSSDIKDRIKELQNMIKLRSIHTKKKGKF